MRRVVSLVGLLFLGACSASSAEGAASSDALTSKATKAGGTPSGQAPSAQADPGAAANSQTAPARPGIEAFPGSKLFMPATTPAPGLILLHGSEGGSDGTIEFVAQDLAKAGFVVVTMCWFGCEGKPDKILRIPLESVVDVGNWLKTSPDVDGGKVGLFGWSRGAELSLLVTSLTGTDPFQAVAVHAPSDTVVGAFDPATEDQPPNFGGILEDDGSGNQIPAPSWTWQGKDLFGEPKADFSVPGPLIQVTQFKGPLYVAQGEQDEVWDVSRGKHVVAERDDSGGLVTKSHFFPGEGHVFQNFADTETETNEMVSLYNAAFSH